MAEKEKDPVVIVIGQREGQKVTPEVVKRHVRSTHPVKVFVKKAER